MTTPTANLDAIKEAQKKAVTAYKDQDYNTILKLHTEDCTMIPPGSAPVKGRAGELPGTEVSDCNKGSCSHGDVMHFLKVQYILGRQAINITLNQFHNTFLVPWWYWLGTKPKVSSA